MNHQQSSQSRTSIRCKVLAALAVLKEGDSARSLLDYMSDSDRNECAPHMERFVTISDREHQLEQLVRQTAASELYSSIAEVHPAWILEYLKGEPPRVLGLLMRSLPSQHVRYVLEHLPPILRERIPNVVESFAVSQPVLNIIRRRFESRFQPMRITRSIEHPGFEHLYFLKGEELEALIREIGLHELAIALSGMPQKALHLVFNRLELKAAKRLQRRMKELTSISTVLYRQARFNLLEIEGRHEGSERMLFSVGLAALSGAVGAGFGRLAKLLEQKLAPADSYLFKRFLNNRRIRSDDPVAAERIDIILKLIALLAMEGRISPEWKRFAPGYVPPAMPDDGVSPSSSTESEDTASAWPLA